MSLFTVDFIQGKTDAADYNQVVHRLEDAPMDRKIISLSVSSDKLQSVSNYSREPKRLVFECFPDAWIQEFIMTGIYEHERYISHYEVKVYRDGMQFFAGIIDASMLSYDVSGGILQLTCYDKLKLLSLFSDLQHYYGLSAGYQPQWILGYFVQDIQQQLPIAISYAGIPSRPELTVASGNPLVIADIDYSDLMISPYIPGGQLQLHSSSFPAPFYGYMVDAIQATVTFIFIHKVIWETLVPPEDVWWMGDRIYKGIFRARIYRFFNGICPQISQYDEDTGWIYRLDEMADYHEEMLQFFLDNGIDPAAVFSLPSVALSDARSYGTSHYIDNWVRATVSGNMIPSKLQMGSAYAEYDDSPTENLKALQAMLMIYNATLYTSANGIIFLRSKQHDAGQTVEISNQDVVSFITKRGDAQLPQMNTLDVLAGDSTQLKELISAYLIGYHGGKLTCDLVVDKIAKYNLALQDTIVLQDQHYAIIELQRDYVKDEYIIKGRLL